MRKFGAMLRAGRTFGVRDGMLRLGYELQRGSGLLSWRMRSASGWESWNLQNIAPGVTTEDVLASRRAGSPAFFFSDSRALESSLKKMLGPLGEASLLAEAQSILAGKLPFFGALSFDCSFPPRWFQNPVTNQEVSPQQPWTQMRFASPVYGDLKFILEPSRFLFVYPLVRAYALTGDESFPEAFWNAIEDWARLNPPMAGPLWICGQESSLRILAWSFALQGFIHSRSTTNERVALLLSMIAAHAWRTAQTLGYARSQRSNHLISEAVGLWTAGTLYPELREAQLWQTLGAHLLHEAVIDQIMPDGVSQQHSFNYHRMILQQLLWALRLAEIHETPLNSDIRDRAVAAFDFMRAWVDPVSGTAPNYGSDDGSLILPLASASYRDFRPMLQLGAAVLKRPGLPTGSWDESVLWFGLKTYPSENTVSMPPVANGAGYFRLGDHSSWALIRAAYYTRRPFQADQLHVDLWWKGMNLAHDPGTYLYNGPVPWNNGLARTAVHNTITVDGKDQMRRAGRFLWTDWAQASGHVYSSQPHDVPGFSEGLDCFEGQHDGYKRFGITHRRTVRWLNGRGWVITDDIEGNGQHSSRLHWLLADLPFEFNDSLNDSFLGIEFNSFGSKICWNIFASVDGLATVIRAGKQLDIMSGKKLEVNDDELQVLGWHSPTYGALQPSVSLLYQTQAALPVRFVTVVFTDAKLRAELRDGAVVILDDQSGIYTIDLHHSASGKS